MVDSVDIEGSFQGNENLTVLSLRLLYTNDIVIFKNIFHLRQNIYLNPTHWTGKQDRIHSWF